MRAVLVAGTLIFVVCIATTVLYRHYSVSHTAMKKTPAPSQGILQPEHVTQNNDAVQFPRIIPGDTCQKARSLLGKETDGDQFSLNWNRNDMKVSVFPDSHCIIRSVTYFIESGRTFTTPDGVVLGKDTIAEVETKLKGRITESSPFVSEGEGHVSAELELPPTSSFPFKTIYFWGLDDVLTNRLHHDPQMSDFTNEKVESYSLDTVPVHVKGEVPYD
jgi:hypothetical protein